MNQPVLSNVVAVGLLAGTQELDLHFIASKMEGSRLNLRRFPGLIVRKSKPKGTVIVFRSGKMLLVGASSVEECHVLALKVAKDIKRATNTNISLDKFRISNIIAHANLGTSSYHSGFKVNLCSLMDLPYALKDDKFSGVYLRTPEFKAAIVFRSGKVTLNGFTEMANLHEGYEKLRAILIEHAYMKKQEPVGSPESEE